MIITYRRFYWLSLCVLLLVSSYPLWNAAVIITELIKNGAVPQDLYARYVIPYAAMSASVILVMLIQPLLLRLKKFAMFAACAIALVLFVSIEIPIESITVEVSSPQFYSNQPVDIGETTIDIYQLALCSISPVVVDSVYGENVTLAAPKNDAYKIHYYFVSFVMIIMAVGVLFGLGQRLKEQKPDRRLPLILRSISLICLLALCIFANVTGFFRDIAPIQTPLASVLTCLFFVVLGASTGIFSGSFMLKNNSPLAVIIPVLLSFSAVCSMYVGEAALMDGELYRFGTGVFFSSVGTLALAPVDYLVILLSGALVWAILAACRRVPAKKRRADTQTMT